MGLSLSSTILVSSLVTLLFEGRRPRLSTNGSLIAIPPAEVL